MKLMICGHGRHGKDTVAQMLAEALHLSFCSSSWVVLEKAIWPNLACLYGESTVVARLNKIFEKSFPCEDCIQTLKELVYAERHQHRQLWADAVRQYNLSDTSKLAREVFGSSDIYVGCRDRGEFFASKNLFDLSIWVEASARVKKKSCKIDKTCKIIPGDCDIVLTNEESIECLQDSVDLLAYEIRQRHFLTN